MSDVFIAGRGLSCALGDSLDASLQHLRALAGHAPQAPQWRGCDDKTWPYFAPATAATMDAERWLARSRACITAVAAEAGASAARQGPLLVASASLNIGGIERSLPLQQDALSFAEQIGHWLDWQGSVIWLSTACTSALNALLSAAAMIRQGLCDDALVLGLELDNDFTQRGFMAMQLLSPDAARPLAATRNGLVLGEAVAALRLSRQPDQPVDAWRIGAGACMVDGRDPTGASSAAIAHCWRSSLAGKRPDLIKLQAAGSPLSDAREVAVLDTLFETTPTLCSLKASIGHTLGASGAAEIALLCAMLDADLALPRAAEPDPQLGHQLGERAPQACNTVLHSILGFGGSHAAVQVQRRSATTAPATIGVERDFACLGRQDQAVPADWREALHSMLGERPRRLGEWAELGLWGALRCLRDAGLESLPAGAIIRVCSAGGPRTATLKALQEIRAQNLPMPFSFLQSQPGQLLASLSAALRWQGDARMLSTREERLATQLACLDSAAPGVLLGWLEEHDLHGAAPISRWLYLRPCAAGTQDFQPATEADIWRGAQLRLRGSELLAARD